MMNSLSLLVALLVSLQCTLETCAQDSRNDLDNNLQANVVPTPRRRLGNAVHIEKAPPATIEMELGTRMVLKCKVLGRPLPSVQWFKNGEPVVYEEQPNDIYPAHASSAAFLVSKLVVTAAVSGDVFTCLATSGTKQERASTTVFTVDGSEEGNLLILQKLYRMPPKPIITEYYTDVFQNKGTEIVLPCRVNSPTKTQVLWQFNEDNVYDSSRLRVLPSGDLLITKLLWSDMGNFTCIAKNMYGKDVVNTFVYPLQP